MAEKDTPETSEKAESKVAASNKPVKKAPVKKTATKKATAKKTAVKKPAAKKTATSKKVQDTVTVEDMHRLLKVLEEGLSSRDKAVDHLQKQIELNQLTAAQNQKIIAKRGVIYKLTFALLAIGVVVVGFDQHTIVKSFDVDMTNVSKDMDKMLLEMTAMRIAMESMSKDFSLVSRDVSSIDKSVTSMSHGVRGMSRDTHEMNRSMDTMTPWTPWK